MPDSSHVIDCAHHLRLAYMSYVDMVRSGHDRSRALNAELRRTCTDEASLQGWQRVG